MSKQPTEILQEGRSILDPVLRQYGFSFEEGPAGNSSGGPYASGTYANGERKLELHYRFSLGLVTYHFNGLSLDHESYMQTILGKSGGNKYPGFSEEPLSAFNALAYDLQHFAASFLHGNFDDFTRAFKAAEQWKKISAFARMAESE